jgi:hypothetical protein
MKAEWRQIGPDIADLVTRMYVSFSDDQPDSA